MSTSPTGRSKQFRLDDESSAILNRIIAANPGATFGRLQLLFRREAGLTVGKGAIAQRKAYLLEGKAPGRFHLTPGQRELLAAIIREDAGASSGPELAAEFHTLAGRTIDPANATRFRRRHFPGLALERDTNRSGLEHLAARRVAEAAARKLDRAKVDRSPRVGKAGRDHSPRRDP